MTIDQDHLWAPMPDREMTDRAATYIKDLGLHDNLLKSGACDLGAFSPKSKLYILAHGHSQMPLFSNKNGKWNATQLAALLAADKLPLDQRDIELLVCHAGESVNNKTAGAKLLSIFDKFKKAQQDKQDTSALQKQYETVHKGSSAPTLFESDPERLLVPLGAQLAQALKDLGYSHFRVICYKCPVRQMSHGGEIWLDLSSKGGSSESRAKDNPKYQVIWQ